MSNRHDRQFIDLFTLVVGALAGIAVGIYFLAGHVGGIQTREIQSGKDYQREVEERIAPVARVAIAGRDNSALAPIAAASAATVPAASAAILTGEQVYQTACFACHGAGIAGAPKFGDKAAWAPRIGEGIAVLHKHALEGYQGKVGVMPPKGGRVDLADQSIMNGVDYMVSAAK